MAGRESDQRHLAFFEESFAACCLLGGAIESVGLQVENDLQSECDRLGALELQQTPEVFALLRVPLGEQVAAHAHDHDIECSVHLQQQHGTKLTRAEAG